MARMTAASVRDLARNTILAAGGRGFVRFLEEGDALLVTDAVRRCADAQALTAALEAAGFVCASEGGLMSLTPGDALLAQAGAPAGFSVDWADDLHPAQALAVRWLGQARLPMTSAGRQLAIGSLRLTWKPEKQVLFGLTALRAQAAKMLREKDTSGMHEAGAILAQWCAAQTGGSEDEA